MRFSLSQTGIAAKRQGLAVVLLSLSFGLTDLPAQVSGGGEIAPVPAMRLPDGGIPLEATLETRTEARTFTLTIPAPRGQILDRNGYPLAQTKVAYYAAINFPYLPNAADAEILRYAQERILLVNRHLGANWQISPELILQHYENRRWLPLTFSSILSDDEARDLRPILGRGLMLHPVYMRTYPQDNLASHIIGYVGKRPPRKTGPVGDGEALWGEGEGADGLEEAFNEQLTGKPGKINVLFDTDGSKLTEELMQRPIPGNNVVTTIDLRMQQLAEKILSQHAKRGAFVIMDVRTGDIVTMASWPQFDLNVFIPSISQEDYRELQEDPDKPLFARAFRGLYPPASTFKVPVALGLLEFQAVTEESLFDCPTSYAIGDRVFHNWNKNGEGSMNVVAAITRSCNTWFYQASVSSGQGVEPIASAARRLGYGIKTGLPLKAEPDGLLPTDAWSRGRFGHDILDGDLANISIGQGTVLATPLQVAQAMAAIGNRERLIRPRLVMQVQDVNNRVTQTFQPDRGRLLNFDPYNLELVIKGMHDVVNDWKGTGKAAANEDIGIAGKTGTGQWKPLEEQNVAWFAGFAPWDYPVYAFAVIYEGEPGEGVGGGRNAGPIVGEFFREYLGEEDHLTSIQSASEDIRLAYSESMQTRPEIEAIYNGGTQVAIQLNVPQNNVEQPAPEPSRESGFMRGLRKLFGGDR